MLMDTEESNEFLTCFPNSKNIKKYLFSKTAKVIKARFHKLFPKCISSNFFT